MVVIQHTSAKYFPWVIETLIRDKYICVDCGSEKNTIVHHIDESRKTGILNNRPDNLVTLCKKCHSKRHGQTLSHPEAIEMREMGQTFQEIANKLGLSRQRVHQIIGRQIWNRPKKDSPKSKITLEVIAIRKNSGLYSKEEIKLMESDLLDTTNNS